MVHHFVFVHGASHGGWCWFKLKNLLLAAGYKATCIDLTGAGINIADPNTVASLDHYNQPLYSFLSHLPHHQKVILVGHSIGGGSVTAAMCLFPSKVSMAVYLAAAMIKPGFLNIPHEIKKMYLGHPETDDQIWDYNFGDGPDKPPTTMIMKEQYVRQKYYNESPMEDYMLATTLLRPAPIKAFEGVGDIPASPQIEGIPRVYIKTTQDHMFSTIAQDNMVEFWPPSKKFVLEGSDHSGFFSAPEPLFSYLLQAADSLFS